MLCIDLCLCLYIAWEAQAVVSTACRPSNPPSALSSFWLGCSFVGLWPGFCQTVVGLNLLLGTLQARKNMVLKQTLCLPGDVGLLVSLAGWWVSSIGCVNGAMHLHFDQFFVAWIQRNSPLPSLFLLYTAACHPWLSPSPLNMQQTLVLIPDTSNNWPTRMSYWCGNFIESKNHLSWKAP